MARTINCDAPGCALAADYMLSVLASGDTRGLCTAHFLEASAAFVMQSQGQALTPEEAAAIRSVVPEPETVDVGDLSGELWACGGCGFEAPSEEMLREHIAAEHPVPGDGEAAGDNVSRETIGVAE